VTWIYGDLRVLQFDLRSAIEEVVVGAASVTRIERSARIRGQRPALS